MTGGTGCGKTFVCKMILGLLADSGVAASCVQILSQDSFYRDLPAGDAPGMCVAALANPRGAAACCRHGRGRLQL